MLTTTGADFKDRIILFVVGVAATLPIQWRVSVKRVWSYGVYYVGYRLLLVHLSCGTLAVSGFPFVVKLAT